MIIIDKKFIFRHATSTISYGDMKDKNLRNAFLSACQIKPSNIVLANQVHSTVAAEVSSRDAGSMITETDALITDDPNISLGIFTADCMPILMVQKGGNVKAAVHAGWPGLLGGIIENTIDKFCNKYLVETKDICVYIGPHIQVCCYEVGQDLRDKFGVGVGNLNLSKIAQDKLYRLGIKDITISTHCTCCESQLFYSYRREKTAKRLLTVI
jgi:YfiH family protein